MKKIILAFCLLSGFASCNNNKDAGSPSAAIDGMFTAMKNGNMDDIKKFITKNDVMLFESAEKFMMAVDSSAVKRIKEDVTKKFQEKVKNVTYTLKNEKVDGDNATVDAVVVDSGKTETHTFNLVKEDGAWKVALSKSGDGMFNSMKGNMGKEDRGAEEALDKLKNMPADSLKMLLNKMLDSADKKEN